VNTTACKQLFSLGCVLTPMSLCCRARSLGLLAARAIAMEESGEMEPQWCASHTKLLFESACRHEWVFSEMGVLMLIVHTNCGLRVFASTHRLIGVH
jgi:hypothetical protein